MLVDTPHLCTPTLYSSKLCSVDAVLHGYIQYMFHLFVLFVSLCTFIKDLEMQLFEYCVVSYTG